MSKPSTKQKCTLEYTINVSPSLLYEYVSDPIRMQEWFADEVNLKNKDTYVFQWKASQEVQIAKLTAHEKDVFIRFQWEGGSEEDAYFEFRIVTTELSKQTILVIEEVVEARDVDSQHQLWDYQVKALMHILGN